MDHDTPELALASPAGMLCHVLKAYSVHPVDLTYAALDKLGLALTPDHITGTHRAILAVTDWMTGTRACPGIDTRDVLDAISYLKLPDESLAVREVASTAVSQLLSWIWGDDICTTTGRRQYIARQLGHSWRTDDGYPTSPYHRTIM